MQNTNKIKPAFPLSLLTCALALATGVASAQTIEVTNGETYTVNFQRFSTPYPRVA